VVDMEEAATAVADLVAMEVAVTAVVD